MMLGQCPERSSQIALKVNQKAAADFSRGSFLSLFVYGQQIFQNRVASLLAACAGTD